MAKHIDLPIKLLFPRTFLWHRLLLGEQQQQALQRANDFLMLGLGDMVGEWHTNHRWGSSNALGQRGINEEASSAF